MKRPIIFLLFIALTSNVLTAQPYPKGQYPFDNPYAFGLDLSFVNQREGQRNQVYYDTDGTPKPAMQIFRDHGFNWGRLMICNEPSPLGQSLEYVVAGAKDLKKYGYHFALDFMMSNGWANPMTQPTPDAWKEMKHEERVKAVYDFVFHVISTLKENGVMPEIVQIGNEIGNGFLWPDGRIWYGDEKRDQSHWKEVADYLNAGSKACRDLEDDTHKVKMMLQVDHGADLEMSYTFFTKMKEYNVDYDVVGYSFYPWSHGTLVDLRDNLYMTATIFGKPIIVIETGYYSTPSQYYTRKGVASPFPETPEGQKEWFQAVNEIVMNTPNNLGMGLFWWEPMSRGRGFFDDETRIAKPIVESFHKYAYPLIRADGNPRIYDFDEPQR